jgi:putative peptide zinc metalloprotease protein
MRFDGYYVFADYLKMDNLQPRAFALAKWRLRNLLFGYKHSAPELMESSKQNLIILYAWFTWIYRFFLFIGIAFLIYHFAFKLLGIILFVIEILWFIALPVLKEMNMWWKLRSELKFSYQLLRTIVLLIFISFIIFYPWKDFQKIPAIYQSEKFITIFPPINSQISDVYVEEKQFVNENQNLIKLKSPQINSEIIQSHEELNLINIKIENALEGILTRADLRPLQSERDKLKIKINNLEKVKSSLLLKSPFEGEIISLTELDENQWVNNKTAVLSIVNKKQNYLIAFISEKDILNIDINKSPYFIPSLIDQPKTEASIISISESPMDNFDLYPMATSLYGGPIAVRKTQAGNIRSETAYYKVTLSLKEQPNLSDQKTMGVVDIGTRSESLMQKFIKFISATLLRELSF